MPKNAQNPNKINGFMRFFNIKNTPKMAQGISWQSGD